MSISFEKTFFILASLIAFVFVIDIGREILIPICFSFLFSFILFPGVKYLRNKGAGAVLSIIINLGGVLLVIAGVLYFFSSQIIRISQEYTNFIQNLREVFDASIRFLNDKVQILPDMKSQSVLNKISQFFSESEFIIVSDTISITTTFFSYLVLTIIYTFLILLYSDQLTKAFVNFVSKKNKKKFKKMLKEVQQVGMNYLTGMLTLILILGVLNSLGLLLLGIDYAFFFGFLAALLGMIPYIGTAIGGLIPTIYALATKEEYWYAIGVIAIFWFVQALEGNFLSPKIIGGNLDINPLFALISLIAGGLLWGVPGMILFLPMVSIVKVVCSYYKELEPVAQLLSDHPEECIRQEEPESLLARLRSKLNKRTI